VAPRAAVREEQRHRRPSAHVEFMRLRIAVKSCSVNGCQTCFGRASGVDERSRLTLGRHTDCESLSPEASLHVSYVRPMAFHGPTTTRKGRSIAFVQAPA
jgi:hypothetical protein